MREAIHPGHGFAFRETGCLRLSDDKRNFRRTSALDNFRDVIPKSSSRSRIHVEQLEKFPLSYRQAVRNELSTRPARVGCTITHVILEVLQFFICHVPIADFANVLGSAKREELLIKFCILGTLRERSVNIKSDVKSKLSVERLTLAGS